MPAMKRHMITLSVQVRQLLEIQVRTGRFKDFSTAVNALLYTALVGTDAVYREYGVTPAEVEASAARVRRALRAERRAGRLRPLPA
jgi:Arc/MetJ-type ribon-helix-helix transcriptional regulator